MTAVVSVKANGYAGSSYPNEGSLLVRPKIIRPGQGKGIICLHGHGADCTTFAPVGGLKGPGYWAQKLAQEGYRVLAIDDMGGYAWSNQAAMDRITDAYNWLTGALGAPAGSVGLMGWSMGGITCLNWMKRHPSLAGAAYLYAPATDLDFFHATAGYTTSYDRGTVAMGAFAGEIDTAYPTYGTSSAGFRVRDEYGSFAGICPIRIAHALDDATIPIGQSRAFVAGVNDSRVSLLEIATGGHVNLFTGIPDTDPIAHFKAAL